MSSSQVVTPTESLKRTPLYPQHAELGARFCSFAGWELPIYYTSILKEHEAVRTKAGLFDVSHLGHLEVSGPDAAAQLQLLVTQDMVALEPGQAIYSPMLNSRGWIMDEMIFYRLEQGRFRMVVNAANGDKILSWLKSRLKGGAADRGGTVHAAEEMPHRGCGAAVEDLREKVGTVALQGPAAAEIFGKVSSLVLKSVPRYHVVSAIVVEKPVWVARTGYTGEDGCEIFAAVEDLPAVWKGLLQAGRSEGIQPAGLGARDTLRLEAGLPLGGSDLDEKTTPLESNLDWTVQWRKGPFMGREALERQRREGITRKLAGFEMRGAGIPRPGVAIFQGETRVGQVTSGTMLAENRAIGMGYVPPQAAKPGTRIAIEIHNRKVDAEIVKLPFYRRTK